MAKRAFDDCGSTPPHESPKKLDSADYDLIKEVWQETPASRQEIALAFGVSGAYVREITKGTKKD